jgi:hypothetical protein
VLERGNRVLGVGARGRGHERQVGAGARERLARRAAHAGGGEFPGERFRSRGVRVDQGGHPDQAPGLELAELPAIELSHDGPAADHGEVEAAPTHGAHEGWR